MSENVRQSAYWNLKSAVGENAPHWWHVMLWNFKAADEVIFVLTLENACKLGLQDQVLALCRGLNNSRK